jgi:enamine deaminase RidA (YjgF/YER057c/UK114 family)
LSGYVHFNEFLFESGQNGCVFATNHWPKPEQIHASADQVLAGLRKLVEAPDAPQFVGVHLFAYRTSITDVYHFVQSLDKGKFAVVRGDEFLILVKQYLELKARE